MVGLPQRAATSAARPDRGAEPWRLLSSARECAIFDRLAGVRVRLASDADRHLLAVIGQTDRDGLEAGALLFGSARQQDVEVVAISGRPSTRRTPTSLRFDPSITEEVIAEMAEVGLDWIGCAHTHPTGHQAPSPTDLASAALVRAGLGLAQYVSVIAVRGRDGWMLVPWVVRAGHGRDICERAHLRRVASLTTR